MSGAVVTGELGGWRLRRAFALFLLALLAVYGVAPFAKAALTRVPASAAARAPLPALQVPTIPLPLLTVPHVVTLPKVATLRVARVAHLARHVVAVHHVARRVVHVRVPVVTDVVSAARAPQRTHATPRAPQPVVVTDTIGVVPDVPPVAAATPTPGPAPADPRTAPPDPAPQPVHTGTMEQYSASDSGDTGTPPAPAAAPTPPPTTTVTNPDPPSPAPAPAPTPTDPATPATVTNADPPSPAPTPAPTPTDPGTPATAINPAPPSAAPPTATPAAPADQTTTSDTPQTSGASSSNNPTAPTASEPSSTVPPDDPADLTAALSGPTSIVNPGSATFTLTVTNSGPDAATNVNAGWRSINSTGTGLPSIATSSDDPAATCSANCVISSLAAGASVQIHITLTFTSGNAGTGSLTAGIISSGIPDPNSANNSATVSYTVRKPTADLAAALTGPAEIVNPGSATFNLTVSNNGPDTATNVNAGWRSINSSGTGLPSIATSSDDPSATCSANCLISSLAPGATVLIHITLTFSSGNAGSGSLTGGIANEDQIDSNTANNNATVSYTVRKPTADLAAALTGPTTVYLGTGTAFTLTVSNKGPDTATDVNAGWRSINSSGSGLPSIATSSDDPSATCSANCLISSLAPGASVQIHITLTFNGSNPGSGSLTAGISNEDQIDPANGNNNATVSYTVVAFTPTLALAPESDSGASHTDGFTNVVDPFFIVSGLPNLFTEVFESSTSIGSATADATGTARIQSSQPLVDGLHTLTARQSYGAGNTTNPAAPIAVVVDTVAPATPVLDLAPAEDSGASNTDNVTNVTAPHFSGVTEGGAQVVFSDGFGSAGCVFVFGICFPFDTTHHGTSADGFGNWSLNPTYTDGTWTLNAKAVDVAGNESPTSTLVLTVDTVAPATPVLDLLDTQDSGTSSSDDITNVADPHFSGTTEAGATVSFTSTHTGCVLIFGICFPVPVTDHQLSDTADPAGAWAIDPLYTDGVYSLSAVATDLAGNASAISTLALTIDTVAPATPVLDLAAAEDTGASDSDDITQTTAPHFSGTTEANAQIVFDDGFGSVTCVFIFGTCFPIDTTHHGTTADASGAWSLNPAYTDGTWTLNAKAVDVAGNESPTSTLVLTVDTVAPAAPVLDLAAADDHGISDTDNITNVTDPHFAGTTEAGVTVSFTSTHTACVFIFGICFPVPVTDHQLSDTADGTGAWAIDPIYTDGVYTLTAVAVDLAGNQSASSNALTITFDTVAPTGDFTLAGTAINGQLATTTPSAQATLAYAGDPAEYAISTDGGATFTAFASYSPDATAALTNGDGLYPVVVLVRDAAGNVVSVSHTVRLDTTGPQLTVASPATNTDVGQTVPFTYVAADVDNVVSQSATLDGATIANGATIDSDTLAAGVDHTIVITAKDALGNTSTLTYVFRVRATLNGLKRAVDDGVRSGRIASQMQTPLLAKLTAGALADFISQVRAQSGKKISASYAALLIGWATDFLARLP